MTTVMLLKYEATISVPTQKMMPPFTLVNFSSNPVKVRCHPFYRRTSPPISVHTGRAPSNVGSTFPPPRYPFPKDGHAMARTGSHQQEPQTYQIHHGESYKNT